MTETGPRLRNLAEQLEEQRLTVLTERIAADLAGGMDAELLGELTGLVQRYPFLERLRYQLMLSLYRCGRQADALAAFQDARRALREELGLDPGPELTELHQRILMADAGLTDRPAVRSPGPASRPVPRQLPPTITRFAGRNFELYALDRMLEQAEASRSALIVAITGGAGVGKSTLALRWAHEISGRFPDGQLYVNLRGFGRSAAPPIRPMRAVRSFLDALDVPPERVPAGLEAQVALYRSLVAGKRILMLLDNASQADQIRPLLPGGSGCVAVVTSRNDLLGLAASDDAWPLPLDVFSAADAGELLRLRPAEYAAGAWAATELIELCARLPLALAIALARADTQRPLRLGPRWLSWPPPDCSPRAHTDAIAAMTFYASTRPSFATGIAETNDHTAATLSDRALAWRLSGRKALCQKLFGDPVTQPTDLALNRFEMNTRHSSRITRESAEQLLDGLAGSTDLAQDPLARVLAAATAPGREAELRGEAAAVAAFEAHHLSPVSIHRRGQMIKSPLAKLLTVKALAAALAVCVTGGVAVAAGTGALSSHHTSANTSITTPKTNTGPAPKTKTSTGTGTGKPAVKKPGTAKASLGAAQLCRELASKVAVAESGASGAAGQVLDQTGLEQALANPIVLQVVSSPTFASLVSTVQGATAVPDYCALLLALPKLPAASELTQIPGSILAQLLRSPGLGPGADPDQPAVDRALPGPHGTANRHHDADPDHLARYGALRGSHRAADGDARADPDRPARQRAGNRADDPARDRSVPGAHHAPHRRPGAGLRRPADLGRVPAPDHAADGRPVPGADHAADGGPGQHSHHLAGRQPQPGSGQPAGR